jgi:hypothetical protein
MSVKRVGILILVFSSAAAFVAPARVAAEETQSHWVAVGYKVGNGLGFVGGDLIVRLPHVELDLHAAYSSDSLGTVTATGYGLAPVAHLQLKAVGHTPYLGLGLIYSHATLEGMSGSSSGPLFTAGYNWRWASNFGVLVGGGIARLSGMTLSNGLVTYGVEEGVRPVLEAAVRYYF